MKTLKSIIQEIEEKNSGRYLKHEWQLYGYRLAKWLGDEERISMYMKLAKNEDRKILQQAWDFVKESNPRSKSRLFLWKLSLLKKQKKGQNKSG